MKFRRATAKEMRATRHYTDRRTLDAIAESAARFSMLPLHSTKSWVGVLAITLFVLGCGTHEQPSSAAGGQSNVSGGAANGGVSMAGGRAGAGSSQSGAANAGAGGSGNTAGDSAGAGASGAAGSGGNAGAAGNAPSLS